MHSLVEERLQKILAKAGLASRRGAEQLIREGRIQVNGQVVTNMGCKAHPLRDIITFDGKQISFEHRVYILLNKPAGYVTTLSDPQGRPVVTDLVADIPLRLFPVGRLDIETEGALLMTNDGALTNSILHPRFEVKKTYEALVSGSPSSSALRHLSQGIEIDGIRTRPAKIRVLNKTHTQTLIEIVIHEGKKRQVRKMFQAVHHKVLHLKRVAYGKLTLGTLASGKYRILTETDIKKIFS
ncbi:pseudouridine synthase [Desulfobulbus oligotrophicus]|jgi:23S rRNA pseudouridine2605 synthase|uniref:pseudouridine synthase n=1 Tax=Desulfobulbus oligotrophicus TaxID=1909699 RepID=UPI001E38BC44|nr:pseudouridine synthase [Desulfobulbus oligotrophicus]MDY0389718.1 pseudouridine synthase [Desulfobulbus oligotrophicus]